MGTNSPKTFCLPGFSSDVVSVNETMDEIARRSCIYERAEILGKNLWWDYNKVFFEECSKDLEACSERVLAEIGQEPVQIIKCGKQRQFTALDSYSGKNLERLQRQVTLQHKDFYEDSKIGKTVGVVTANRKIIYKEGEDVNTNFKQLMDELCRLIGPTSPEPLLGRECVCASSGMTLSAAENVPY